MRRLIPFVRPAYRGPRFDDNVLPLELLGDLTTYRELVADLAASLYRRAHPERARLPRGFLDGLQLGLAGVDPGSAIPRVERVVDDSPLFTPEGDYFSQAQDLIDRALRAANDGAEIPAEFPSDLLLRFNRLGRGLRDDEHIVWNRDGRDDGPRYDRAVRKRLVLSRAPSYEQEVDLEGFVVGHEWPQGSPGGTLLVALPASNVKVAFGPELANNARRVMGNRDPFVRFVGTGVFDRTDRLQRVIETQVLDPIEPVDASREVAIDRLTNQIATIAALRDGWFDGDGTAFAPALLREVRDTMIALLDRGVSPPLMYPTPDGEIRAEWSPSRPYYVSAAFDVAGQRVYLHSAPGLHEAEFDEAEHDVIDLDAIVAFLRAHGFAKEPLE
jgi:hypothetical protein